MCEAILETKKISLNETRLDLLTEPVPVYTMPGVLFWAGLREKRSILDCCMDSG